MNRVSVWEQPRFSPEAFDAAAPIKL
jgi:hypothetical protein